MAHESHYSHFLLGLNPLMQGLEHNHELLGIESEIEMPQVPPKHHSSHSPNNFIHRDLPESSNKNFGMATAVTTWPVNDSSSMSLFACQGSEQLNRKLSLSLFNVKPADTIAVPESSHHSGPGIRWQSKAVYPQQEQLFMQERREYSTSQRLFHLKNSKYLKPVQELLGECCNIGGASSSKEKPKKAGHWEELEPSSSWHLSLFSMNHLELHKLKIKLFSMLEEVDKKYRKYRHQMKTAVSLFESTAGGGSANVYTTLASKAMSRHFRHLKDGIVVQINAVKKAMGEKDPITPAGVTRGQTPRLKLLDQCIRHQKAFQQGVVQQLPWRPQRGLPELSVSILRAWLFEHFLHPYPNDVDKIILARQTGLSRSQVSNWFINARVRIWKPMVEEMYLEETKELNNQSKHPTGHQYSNIQNPNSKSILGLDPKPLPVQLLNDSESLASVINSSHHGDQIHRFSNKTLLPHQSQQQQQQQQVSGAENFSVVDFDFSSYSDFASDNFRSSVSLTLGLQQHNRGGMSLSFSPATQQPLLFGKEHVDHGQQLVEFSILDGEAQTFAQRNLMGTQLLHDLAG